MKTRGVVRSFDVHRGYGTCTGMENILTGHQGTTAYWIYGRHIMSMSREKHKLEVGQWIEFDVYDNAPGIAYNIRKFDGQGLFGHIYTVPDVVSLYRKHLSEIRFKNQVCKLQSQLTAFMSSMSSSSPSSFVNTIRTSAS